MQFDNVKEAVRNAFALLHSRRISYRITFQRQNRDAQAVLKDLARFCHWGATPFTNDPRATDVMIGRQQVLLRIKQHLNLTDEQLFAIYNGQPMPQNLEEPDEYDR